MVCENVKHDPNYHFCENTINCYPTEEYFSHMQFYLHNVMSK